MPILEFAPPSPAPAAAPPAGSKSPLSPASRVLSFNSDNNNPLSTTTATASPVKSGLKSPSTRRSPLDENSSVRFSPVNGRAESRAGPQAVVVEARQEEQQQEDIETEDIAEDKEEEDVSMDMQSEDGATRSGAGAPATQLSRSGSASSVASAAGDLVPLHVEVRLKSTSSIRFDLIRRIMHTHLDSEYETLLTHSELQDWREVPMLEQHVERVWIGECTLPTSAVQVDQITLQIHVYQPSPTSTSTDFSTNSSNDEDGDSDAPAASSIELPNPALEGMWDTLIYDGDIKGKLLNYIYSTMLFSDANIDFNIVSWNRVVLLHGPPGTGKTSLCKALAQKLAIRLSDRYSHGKLIEINSHSLFSKWFSESGKLVQRLFASVTEMVEDESGFVVVLIDEVESLTAARAGAMSGKEPSDALRVVNALLTQLDKLKHRKNCLVMTTSNLSGAIDNAFIDRADIKQYIGLPPPQAVYWILQSCLKEIVRAGLIAHTELREWTEVDVFRSTGEVATDHHLRCSSLLYDLANLCQGMSGRTLRRLPVLAHARHIGMSLSRPPMEVWLKAMFKCVEEEKEQMSKIDENL